VVLHGFKSPVTVKAKLIKYVGCGMPTLTWSRIRLACCLVI